MSSTIRAVAVAATLAATVASASGFYFGDNGTKALSQGGAFTGQADDLTAIMYNPAGLARMDGVNFLLDLALLNHDASFDRLDKGFDVNAPPKSLANTVYNTGGIFLLPFIGVSYGFQLANHRLTFALGLYGPPSVGRYNYGARPNGESQVCGADGKCVPPEPNYARGANGKYLETPTRYAPSRYSLINNDVIILYPTLSVAYEVHRRFQFGVSLQLIYSHFQFRQALSSQQDIGLPQPMKLGEEDPVWDSIVSVDMKGEMIQHGLLSFTGVAGVMAQPIDNLSIGVSVRPPIFIKASGRLDIALGEAASAANAKVMGDTAELTLNLPLEVRVGAHFKPIDRLGLNLDFVYYGWQSIDELVLTPQNISLSLGGGTPQKVAPFHIPKKWHESVSVRLGGSFDVIKYLSVQAGILYETAATPTEYIGIDFLHFDRAFLTAGVTGHLWKLDLLAGVAWTPTVTRVVDTSEVRQGITTSDPARKGAVVGNGVYNSGGWIVNFGVRGHFGTAPPPPPPALPVEPAPIPAPVPEPAPAPAPEPAPAPLPPAAPAT